MAGVYGNSPLSQIAGLGTLLGSGFNTSSGWGNQLMKFLSSGSGSGSGSGTSGGATSDSDLSWLTNAGANDRSYVDSNGNIIGTGTAVGEGE
jgi:hypothetical protein